MIANKHSQDIQIPTDSKSRRAALKSLAEETRILIGKQVTARASFLTTAVNSGPIGKSMPIDEAAKVIREG